MDKRIPVAIVAIVELLGARRLLGPIVRLTATGNEEVRPRRGAVVFLRLTGLVLLGWVLWASRETLGYAAEEFDEEIELEEIAPPEERTDEPRLTPGTRRHDIASVLYHAEEPMAASDVVDLSEGTEWEMGRSTASATLYRMFNDDLVAREERADDGSYEYWLTADGRDLLESADDAIRPDPFTS